MVAQDADFYFIALAVCARRLGLGEECLPAFIYFRIPGTGYVIDIASDFELLAALCQSKTSLTGNETTACGVMSLVLGFLMGGHDYFPRRSYISQGELFDTLLQEMLPRWENQPLISITFDIEGRVAVCVDEDAFEYWYAWAMVRSSARLNMEMADLESTAEYCQRVRRASRLHYAATDEKRCLRRFVNLSVLSVVG